MILATRAASAVVAVCVEHGASLRDALRALQAGDGVAVVVGERSFGVVDESALRAQLLAGASLDTPLPPAAVSEQVLVVPSELGRVAVLDRLQSQRLEVGLAVDDGGVLTAVHTRRKSSSPAAQAVAVLVAGGRGLRLRPHTDVTPKALLPVAGIPIIERLVLHLVGHGITQIYVAVGHLASSIVERLGDGAGLGCSISYLYEDPDDPLGTAGWLALLPDQLRLAHAILVMNADLVTEFSVTRLLSQHRLTGAAATVGVAAYSHQVPYGVVRSEDGFIQSLVEKPVDRCWVNTGIYVLNGSRLATPVEPHNMSMVAVINGLLQRGLPVRTFPIAAWEDVGRIDDLRIARGQYS